MAVDKIARLQQGSNDGLWSAARGNQLIDLLNSLGAITVSPAAFGRFEITKDGALLVILPQALVNSGLAGGSARGFKCTANLDGSTDAVLVKYGIVNSIVPDGMSPGDVPPYVIDKVGSNGFTCLGVVVGDVGDPDEGVAVSAFIQCFADTMPDDTRTIFYQQIGSYATTDGVFTVETDGDGIGYQRFELCGGLGGTPEFAPA